MKKIAMVLVALVLVTAACNSSKTPTASGGKEAKGGGNYCDIARALEASGDKLDKGPDLSDPAKAGPSMRALFADMRRDIGRALAAAPSEIKADLELLASAFADIIKSLESINYDFTKATPETFAKFNDPKFKEAGDRLDAYAKRVCGIDPDATSS